MKRVIYLAAMGLVAFVLSAPSPAGAQEAPSAKVQLKARLVEFPSFVGPQDSLRIGLEVTNSGTEAAEKLRIAFSIYERVETRSQLVGTFEGRLGLQPVGDTVPIEGSIEPGQTRRIEADKMLSEISALRSAEEGAYPVRIIARADKAASNRIDTHMVYFLRPTLEPLRLSLIIPLHSPSMYTDAREPVLITSSSLEKAIESGRINAILEALERHPDAPVTLAPSGLFLDMLADLSNGYVRRSNGRRVRIAPEDPRAQTAAKTLARIRLLTQRPQTRLITMPYSAGSLPGLVKSDLEDRAQAQVFESRTRLGDEPTGILDAQPLDGWLLPSHGSLDERTLSELQRAEVKQVILASQSLRQSPEALTRAKPVQLETRTGRLFALVEDTGLKSRLNDTEDLGAIVARQRFLADTATIMLERPSQKRAVAAVAPTDWRPEGPELEGILSSLTKAPWLSAATPDSILSDLPPTASSRIQVAPLETVINNGPALPPVSYFTSLREARRAIQQYADLAPPANKLAALQRRLLISEGADWWAGEKSVAAGQAFADSIEPTVKHQMSLIEAPGQQTITLTSRTGVIPLSIRSGLRYPVDVVVRLDSDKLRFPDGNRIVIQKLRRPNQTLEVRTIAQASGTFPLRVQIQTPRGIDISSSRLTIRSTAYNVVALSITAGAAIFLVGWWILGTVRKRVRLKQAPS